MFKKFLLLITKIESKMSNRFKENVFRNVFLYPLFILILQTPILLTQQIVYSVVFVSLAFMSLIGYFLSLKARVVCQLAYPVFLFWIVILTILSYIGFFIHIEIYNYMFIFLQTVGMIMVINVIMMYCGESKDSIKHSAIIKFTSSYDKEDLVILNNFISNETILCHYVFSSFKEIYKAYIQQLDLYISIDSSKLHPSGIGCYVVADNFEFLSSYSLLDFINYIKDNDLKFNEITKKDFEVFMMNIY